MSITPIEKVLYTAKVHAACVAGMEDRRVPLMGV
jgi:hypothetical protein